MNNVYIIITCVYITLITLLIVANQTCGFKGVDKCQRDGWGDIFVGLYAMILIVMYILTMLGYYLFGPYGIVAGALFIPSLIIGPILLSVEVDTPDSGDD